MSKWTMHELRKCMEDNACMWDVSAYIMDNATGCVYLFYGDRMIETNCVINGKVYGRSNELIDNRCRWFDGDTMTDYTYTVLAVEIEPPHLDDLLDLSDL